MVTMNTTYTRMGSAAVSGSVWREDIIELMECARLLEGWLGYDPVTSLEIERRGAGASESWLNLQAYEYDSSAYGSTPSILDVIDQVRVDALGLGTYSWSFTLPSCYPGVSARNEMQSALGRPICELHTADSRMCWRDHWKLVDEEWIFCEQSYDGPQSYGHCRIVDIPYWECRCSMQYSLIGPPSSTAAWTWWGQSSEFVLLTQSGGVVHDLDEVGAECRIQYYISTSGTPPTDAPSTAGDLVRLTQTDVIGDAGISASQWTITSDVSGIPSGKYIWWFLAAQNETPPYSEEWWWETEWDWITGGGSASERGWVWGLP